MLQLMYTVLREKDVPLITCQFFRIRLHSRHPNVATWQSSAGLASTLPATSSPEPSPPGTERPAARPVFLCQLCCTYLNASVFGFGTGTIGSITSTVTAKRSQSKQDSKINCPTQYERSFPSSRGENSAAFP